jgi:hypothetical protein
MATGYSKQFLIDAFMFRYCEYNLDSLAMEKSASDLYDRVGKDRFREYACLDAAEVNRYRNFCLEHALPM